MQVREWPLRTILPGPDASLAALYSLLPGALNHSHRRNHYVLSFFIFFFLLPILLVGGGGEERMVDN